MQRTRLTEPNAAGKRAGITLAEVVISTFLVSVLMLAALGSVGTASLTYRSSATQTDGADAAGDLLAEILAMAYSDPQTPTAAMGLDSGESFGAHRLLLDDVDDYHGYSESTLKSRAGSTIPNYTGWSRNVIVERVSATNPNTVLGNGDADSGLKRIKVVATGPSNKTFTVYALRANSGGLQQNSPTTNSVVTSASVQLQLPRATSVTAGAAVVNHSVGN
jgi:hypothetical protein